jgi:hypothetical protein
MPNPSMEVLDLISAGVWRSEMRSDEVVELAGTMYDAHDLNAAGQDPVKDQVVANRKQAEIRSDVGASATEVRMISEQHAPLVEVLKDAIRSVWIVRGDVEPKSTKSSSALAVRRSTGTVPDPSLATALLLGPAATGLRLDRFYVLEATRAAGKPLLPEPSHFLNGLRLHGTPLFPLAQGLPHDLAGGCVLPARNGLPDQARHFLGQGDAEFLDVCHALVPLASKVAILATSVHRDAPRRGVPTN